MTKREPVVVTLKVDAGDFLTENAIIAIRAIVRDEVMRQLGLDPDKAVAYAA